MKKTIVCFFLLVMSACYVEESGRVCSENDSSITVSTLLDASIDSVRYFLKGELICSSPKSKGEHLERNVFCDGEYCVKESSLEGYERRVIDYCAVGSLCDNLGDFVEEIQIVFFSQENADTVRLSRSGSPKLEFGKFYRVYRKSDSELTKILNGDSFENDSCFNNFCVANHKSTFGMCKTEEIDGVEKKNVCSSNWIAEFYESIFGNR